MASVEDRKIKSLVAMVVEYQMRKLELKMKQFEELEAIMDRERETVIFYTMIIRVDVDFDLPTIQLEAQRQQLIQDRIQFQMDQIKAIEARAKHQAGQNLTLQGTVPPNFPGVYEAMLMQQQQALMASEIHTFQHPAAQIPQQPPPQQQVCSYRCMYITCRYVYTQFVLHMCLCPICMHLLHVPIWN